MSILRRAGLIAALATAPLALAYRFAIVYRVRAGHPRPSPPRVTPAAVGLWFEDISVPSPGTNGLPGWFIPARGGQTGPGIVLIHGWESARDRTLPMAQFLHAAGFHVLTVDVRGHGANSAETLPVTAGEFGTDGLAGFRALIARPEVTTGAVAGHSMGAIGAILAGAADDRVAAVVATSAPADPYRLTRQTFRLARLPLPDPIAYPLAFLTTRVFLKPRGHRVRDINATIALNAHARPVFLAHGDADDVVPVIHLERLRRSAAAAGREVQSLVIAGGHHSWLYEVPEYRSAVARFLAEALGGPYSPDEAAERAAAVEAVRLPDGEVPFAAIEDEPGGFRSLARIAVPAGRPDPARNADVPTEARP